MVWFRFTASFNHTWPSRAVSEYRPDRGVDGQGLYNVKREVADAAIAAGKGTEVAKPAKHAGDGAEREATDGLAGGDPAADGDHASPDELEPDAGDRDAAELPGDAGA